MHTDTPSVIELENGIRIVHLKAVNTKLVHCGVLVNAGTRDENTENNGIAHFIEHAVFKATNKRRGHHILKRLENVGGELDAYTTKEYTCYYTACLSEFAGRAIELISDIVFNATFPVKELEKEKRVIFEEIEMYEDSPEDSIFDDFFMYSYPKHPLGYNILGTKKSVKSITREDILSFRNSYYTNQNIVLSVVGNISKAKVESLAKKYFNQFPKSESSSNLKKRQAPLKTPAFNIEESKPYIQAHCMVGCDAYDYHDVNRYKLILLNNILGGEAQSSRLNLEIREKYGYSYNIGSQYTAYSDTGIFSIYLGTDNAYLKKCLQILYRELNRIKNKKLGVRQLHISKKQIIGQAAMLQENNSILMQNMGRSLLLTDKVSTLDNLMQKIDEVTAIEIMETANELFDESKLCSLIYKSDNK